MPRLYLYCWR